VTGWQLAIELAGRELALVRAGEWEHVAEVSAERAAQAASLATPGPRSALERLAALEAELIAALKAARASTVRELGSLRRGRGAMQGYAGASEIGPRIGYVDHAV
jgi:hypothetical protein